MPRIPRRVLKPLSPTEDREVTNVHLRGLVVGMVAVRARLLVQSSMLVAVGKLVEGLHGSLHRARTGEATQRGMISDAGRIRVENITELRRRYDAERRGKEARARQHTLMPGRGRWRSSLQDAARP